MNACRDKTGTDTGYQRHRAAGEDPCGPCRAGHNELKKTMMRGARPADNRRYRVRKRCQEWMAVNAPEALALIESEIQP